jgi:3-oxoadipate enol-lactonase
VAAGQPDTDRVGRRRAGGAGAGAANSVRKWLRDSQIPTGLGTGGDVRVAGVTTERIDVTVGGVRIACFAGGPPSAPAMVLLHALGQDSSTWEEVRPAFEERFRVVAVDCRGHGSSARPGEYSFDLMRGDVVGVLDELGMGRVSLVGHSMGGGVALRIAEEHPERVERLVLEDVAPPYPRTGFGPGDPPEDVSELPFDWPVVPAIIGQVNDPDPSWWDLLGKVTAPTLFVAGGSDSHIDQGKIAEAAALLDDATVVTIPSGHQVHAPRPQEFVEAVLGWIDRPAV